jgi:succinyl-diaminopimelate desuccinylase
MSPVVVAVRDGVQSVLDREATLVASPGTYDHKHVTNFGGVTDCIAYGPGALHLAHQPDEWCGIDDLVAATKVLALSILKLVA